MIQTLPALLLMVCLSGAASSDEPSLLVKNLASGKAQHLVAYGTSLTAGGAWVTQVKDLLTKKYGDKITVTNSGQGGMWSKWGLENLDARVLRKKPDTVLIEWAINDAFLPYTTSIEQAQKNLESMLDQILKQNPACEIILMTMNLPVGTHLEKRPEIAKYYQMYRDVAKARKLCLIDHEMKWKDILEKDKAQYMTYVPDGIHPNAKGSEMVILPALEASLFGKVKSR